MSHLCLNEKRIIQSKFGPICYRLVGQGDRRILFFHGFPGSSAQVAPFEELADDLNLTVLCIDRPGYSDSAYADLHQFDLYNAFIEAVTLTLGWTSFELLSVSGGTPFLFHYLEQEARKIKNVTVVCGLGPLGSAEIRSKMKARSKLILRLLPFIPGKLIQAVLPKNVGQGRSSSGLIRYFMPMSESDRRTSMNLEVQKILGTAISEAFKQGGIGPKRDARTYLNWSTVKIGTFQNEVQFWHGEEDQIVPVAIAEEFSKLTPKSKLRILQGEGHYSLPFNRMREILESISQ